MAAERRRPRGRVDPARAAWRAATDEKPAAAGGGGSVPSVDRLGMREAPEPEGRIVWKLSAGERKWRKSCMPSPSPSDANILGSPVRI